MKLWGWLAAAFAAVCGAIAWLANGYGDGEEAARDRQAAQDALRKASKDQRTAEQVEIIRRRREEARAIEREYTESLDGLSGNLGGSIADALDEIRGPDDGAA